MPSIATLKRIQPQKLSELILAEAEGKGETDPSFAVIDVRDDGTFPLSHADSPLHLPIYVFLAPPPPSQFFFLFIFPQTNSSADHIGGHIRGSQNIPSRLIDAMLPTLVRQLKNKKTVVFHCALSQQRGPSAALKYVRERERMMPGLGHLEVNEEGEKEEEQEVYVLDRGFVGWQEVYGTDERLTEGYRKELWAEGYWG
jgi:Cdc25 family phosphatase